MRKTALVTSVLCLTLLFASTTYAYDVEALEKASIESGQLVTLDNGRIFIDTNPGQGRVKLSDGRGFTGMYHYELTDTYYCYKNGIAVQFNGEANRYLYKDEVGNLQSAVEDLNNMFTEFKNRYNDNRGFNEIFWQTKDIKQINAFEQLIKFYYGNDIIWAGQHNIIKIEETDNNYYVSLRTQEELADFKHCLDATNNFLYNCDVALSNIIDVRQKIINIDHFICNSITYDRNGAINPKTGYPYSEISAIAYGYGTNCSGYSSLYRVLCQRYGVEVRTIKSMSLNHAWNVNNIDGVDYYTDSCWNDCLLTKDYLLKLPYELAESHYAADIEVE